MRAFIKKELPFLLLGVAIIAYSIFFSIFTILRTEKMHAQYFDLGIMNQTVHNTYMSLRTGDPSRFLELTNPHPGDNQVKRMAIHNDILLAIFAPFYFIHDGPETLLVIQAFVVALGALFLFLIAEKVLIPFNVKATADKAGWIALALGISYLLYPPLQKSNAFEFHAVTLAPTLLLAMYYYWFIKKYFWSFVCAVLAIFSKEQVGLVTGFFALYSIIVMLNFPKPNFALLRWAQQVRDDIMKNKKNLLFALTLGVFSLVWVVLSMKVIIPVFRGSEHFGSDYYSYLSNDPFAVIPTLFRAETYDYLHELLSPVLYLSLLSPLHLAIALPEFAVVLLSANSHMRNTFLHYDAILDAFIFLSATYGIRNIYLLCTRYKIQPPHYKLIISIVLIPAFIASYFMSSLPWARNPNPHPWETMSPMVADMRYWREYLDDDTIPVAPTGKLSPHFTNRRYFYDFAPDYTNAEYVLIDVEDARIGFMRMQSSPAYDMLQSDNRYVKIYNNNGLEVYKRIIQ